jgi:2-polyprenyl-3-methyl-5-hydroxy-6-metoxy-1,4-benzoquinol methylase
LSDDEKVMKYFHTQADSFDTIYSGKKNAFLRFLDAHLRKDMQRRFEMTFKECESVVGKSILDIGCGSGRYSIEFAKRGVAKVVGLDYATNMIQIAKRIAENYGVAHICDFICIDFLEYQNQDMFDIALAIGVFDYVKDPTEILSKMCEITREKVITTFPVKWTYRMPLRKIRLNLQGCPVYFFTEKDIEKLFQNTGYQSYQITYKGQIYFVVATPKRKLYLA